MLTTQCSPPASSTRTWADERYKPRRERLFGEGRSIPLDRNAKARIMTLARALTRRTEPGRHYGVISAKFLAVLNALLWGFHNAQSGRCFPSYERIAEKADCARSTVYEAIHALERAGLLSWVNRLVRIREWGPDLFGRAQNRWRVIRTSNAYTFVDPQPQAKPSGSSKSELPTGTTVQDLISSIPRTLDGSIPLHQALERWGRAQQGRCRAPRDESGDKVGQVRCHAHHLELVSVVRTYERTPFA
jgi:Helix-turn-helix domain